MKKCSKINNFIIDSIKSNSSCRSSTAVELECTVS